MKAERSVRYGPNEVEMPLPTNEIESELSYAYLHAVASRAGFGCKPNPRHEDNVGLDATIRILEEKLDPKSTYTNFPIDVQLKATSSPLKLVKGRFSYFLKEVSRYDRLRKRAGPFPTILVILQLPKDGEKWLTSSHRNLVLRHCAYWVSLWDAPESTNATGETVYIPKGNILSVAGLRELARKLSCEEELTYAE